LGTTVKNYEAVNKELPLNIPEYLFDNIIEQLGASKIKRPAIRKDIEAKLENFDIDIDEFFSPDDIGQVAVWNVTNTKLRDIAITDSGK
jgi:hypothetical protein